MDKIFQIHTLKKDIKKIHSIIIITIDAINSDTGESIFENIYDGIEIILEEFQKIITEFDYLKNDITQNETYEKTEIILEEILSLLKLLKNGLILNKKNDLSFNDLFNVMNIINTKYKTLMALINNLNNRFYTHNKGKF